MLLPLIILSSETACIPVCIGNCSNHGVCILPNVCQCDLGYVGRYYWQLFNISSKICLYTYVGETCSVQCECNGHSDCVDDSIDGRAICIECLHNTQVHISYASYKSLYIMC